MSSIHSHSIYLSAPSTNDAVHLPFIEHPQFSAITDILSRKEQHHVQLVADFSQKNFLLFLSAFLFYLKQEKVSRMLQSMQCIYLYPGSQREVLDRSETLKTLCDAALEKEEYFLIAYCGDKALFEEVKNQVQHPACRLLVLTLPENKLPLSQAFDILPLDFISEKDQFILLKNARDELQQFHQVLIPDEILREAQYLAKRYLPKKNNYQKTLLLIDSAAGRAKAAFEHQSREMIPGAKHQIIVNAAMLANVLAASIKIPAPCLMPTPFKRYEFAQKMERQVVAQEVGITLLGEALQQGYSILRAKSGPLCSLLFAGAAGGGKKTMAYALSEQFFKSFSPLFIAEILHSDHLATLKLREMSNDHAYELQFILSNTPYAIIFLDHVEKASPSLLAEIFNLLSTGWIENKKGERISAHHAILILSTSLGSYELAKMSERFIKNEIKHPKNDWLELMMNEPKKETFEEMSLEVQTKLVQEIWPAIIKEFAWPFHKYLHLIPFFPLSFSAIEKIIHLKLIQLGQKLKKQYYVDFNYAQEVVIYLAKRIDKISTDIDKILQEVYKVVEEALFHHMTGKRIVEQLFLQLNDTGQLLRCHFAKTREALY